MSLLLYNVLQRPELNYTDVIGYAVIVFQEGSTGLLIGFSANICNSIVLFAGNIIDMDIGLSMASEYDPTLKDQTTISGSLYYYTVFLLLMVSGLYQFLISAIVDTYTIIPINGLSVNPSLYSSVVTLVSDYFIIGFRIALPVFVSLLIVNCVLGILAKVASQLNMFAVGIQIKILAGLVIMFVTVGLLPQIANFIYQNIKAAVKLIAGGLR